MGERVKMTLYDNQSLTLFVSYCSSRDLQRRDLLHRADDHLVFLRRGREIVGQVEKVPAESEGTSELDQVQVPLQEVGHPVQ